MNPAGGPPPRSGVGGLSVPEAIASEHNLRIIRTPIQTFSFREGIRESVRIPNVGYVKQLRVIVKLAITVTPGTGSATAGDFRNLIRQLTTTFQGSNRPHDLDGIGENLFNNLDLPVLVNKITAPSGTLTAQTYNIYLELTPQYGISETNLLGILYVGGSSTYASLDISQGLISEAIVLTGNATAVLASGTVDVYMEWVDEREPIPETVIPAQGDTPPQYVPGQGLWRETSMLKYVQLHDTIQLTSAGQQWQTELPRGPIYTRIGLLYFAGTSIDVNDTLPNTAELVSQQIASLRRETVDSLDRDYRESYLKNRPGGWYVMTFLDKTGSDRDLLHTGGLGRLQVKGVNALGVTPAANSRIRIYTETLVALTRNASY